ncbi:unnamed protein product [Vicia faba]|uniref:Uncharacterized protein n=1 Tax=Vicia faba TaxID=3906 RepID=A0AAV0ZVW7_VICFA|nr:unnamed protein product [Vicia faba]
MARAMGGGPGIENSKDNERSARLAGGRSCGQVLGRPTALGPDGFVCPSLANRIPAQRHSAPYRSRSVFATAGEAVVEAKPIATPTIKDEIGPLLKDLMEWPTQERLCNMGTHGWKQSFLMVLISGRNNQNKSPDFFVAKCYGLNAELLTLLVRMGVHPKVFPDRMHTYVSNLVQHGKFN